MDIKRNIDNEIVQSMQEAAGYKCGEKTIKKANKPIHATITIPGSKSITNRALLLAALSDDVCEISDVLISDDTRALVNALSGLGVKVELDEVKRSCVITGCGGQFPKKEASIWCEAAGTVGRFLLAACASSAGTYHFDALPQLRDRPIAALLQMLCAQGAGLVPENAKQMPFTILGSGGLLGGEIIIDGSETGQFVSALLMVGPFAQTPFLLKVHDLVSRPYIDMTCNMMAEFGVLVHRLHNECFSIPVPQRYFAQTYTVEPDMSTASYFFAAAAVTGGEITIQPVSRKKSLQGDIEFLSALEKMGCHVIENKLGLTVKGPKELVGINVDMRDYSDTFMTLAAVAPFAKTPTTITNIAHARHKESDRIAVMRKELEKLNIRVEEGPDWIKIFPSMPKGAEIDSHEDHRIAMAFSVIGLRVSDVVILGAECVAKTCPNFFALWDGLY